MILNKIRFREGTFDAVSLAVIGAAIVLLIAGVIYYVQQNEQKKAIQAETTKTNQLIIDLQASVNDNHRLQQENRNYAYCNAVLLAKYTQDHQPIVIEDLNKCIFTSFPRNNGPSVRTQSNGQAFLTPQTPSDQSSSVLQPVESNNPSSEPVIAQTTPEPILTAPGIINLNTPCINLLKLITTCK